MQSLLVGVQLCDYQEPQALAGFCKCLLFFQRAYPEILVTVMESHREKEYFAGIRFLLTAKQGNYDLFFMTSGDIVLKPLTLIRLYERDMPIISGMIVESRGQHRPFLFKRAGVGQYEYKEADSEGELINRENPGSGCLLIRKEVFNQLPSGAFSSYKGIRAGDSSFFERVHEVGYRVFIDPKVRVGHIGHDKTVYWPKTCNYMK